MFKRFAIAVLLASTLTLPTVADSAGDGFIKGYAAAILERELNIRGGQINVTDGDVTVDAPLLGAAQRTRIVNMLLTIDGVKSVQVTAPDRGEQAIASAQASSETAAAPSDGEAFELSPQGTQWLPRGTIFDPLLADPRWPHMQASIQKISNHENAYDTITTSIGGSLALIRGDTPDGGQWEFDLQPAVYAQFDMDSDLQDIISADYIIAGALTYAKDDWQAMLRFGHQSSHIGDEFLPNPANAPFTRLNFAYEWIDLIVSRHLMDRKFRVYGGGKVRINTDPNSLEELSVQYGAEWKSDKTYLSNRVRPIAAVDVQHYEHHDWEASVSLRAGVQLEDPLWDGHLLQLLFEYYNGANPVGQFFLGDRIGYWGIGAHFYY